MSKSTIRKIERKNFSSKIDNLRKLEMIFEKPTELSLTVFNIFFEFINAIYNNFAPKCNNENNTVCKPLFRI